ncbi:MAG: Smr/MutS family protein [Pseudomonadota bacterium]
MRIDWAPDPMDALRAAAPAMDARVLQRLRKGKLKPEARLDLHGMTLDRAHPALTQFILSAQAQGRRLVLVITGKGRAAQDAPAHRRGILRNAVPGWLGQAPLRAAVMQVVPAHDRHGGGGAYYVYLRRRR